MKPVVFRPRALHSGLKQLLHQGTQSSAFFCEIRHDAEVIQAGQIFTDRHSFGTPSLMDQTVVSQKLSTFVAASDRVQNAFLGSWPQRWTGHSGMLRCELQRLL